MLSSIKYQASLDRVGEAGPFEYGLGPYSEEPIERAFEPFHAASLPLAMSKPVAEPGFITCAESAIKMALEAVNVQADHALILTGVSRSERTDDGGVRVLPLAKIGGNLPILRLSVNDFARPGCAVQTAQ
eukprot:4518536-Amphidinium_carterae.1